MPKLSLKDEDKIYFSMTDYRKIGLLSIQQKDCSPYRKLMWAALKKKSSFAKFSEYLFTWPTIRFLILFVWLLITLIRCLRLTTPKSNYIWAVYRYENEKKAVAAFLETMLPSHAAERASVITFSQFNFKNIFLILKTLILFLAIAKQYFSEIKKNSFVVCLRQLEFLIFYEFWVYYFKNRVNVMPRWIISSSESNPEIIGLTLAAKKFGATLVFINHGSLANDLGIFFHDLVVVTNFDLKNKIQRTSVNISARYIVIGRRQSNELLPLTQIHRILIVGSILTSDNKLNSLFSRYRAQFPAAEMFFRLHPNHLVSQIFNRKYFLDFKVDILTADIPIKTQAKDFDLVLVGSTSVPQELLENMQPSFFVDIDDSPQDLYGFISKKLIPRGDLPLAINNEYAQIYLNSEWKNILAYFCPMHDANQLEDLRKLFQA